MTFTRPPNHIYFAYHIRRGEQGVLTYEPYKSYLLPLWRFRTVPIAQESSEALWTKFLQFHKDRDFIGMDMARKYIQMGMTRAKRYANHKGGRKYEKGEGGMRGKEIEKSKGHEGKEEKEQASLVFREVWERCKAHEGYAELKKQFLKEQKEWEGSEEREIKPEEPEDRKVKLEPDDEDQAFKLRKSSRVKIKEEKV